MVKDWGGRIPVALVYPNRYAVGMANLGFQLVYSLLNDQEDVVCERFFFPEPGSRGEAAAGAPLSLETQQPLNRFEIVAFSVPFENDYPHVPSLLAASGIPTEAARRHPPHPLVWAGGVTASLNPEPLAPFVDLFGIGEAEVLIPDLLEAYRRCRMARASKGECLESFSGIEGVYVPSLYRVRYDRRGFLVGFQPRGRAPERVRRRAARDLGRVVPTTRILAPDTEFESMFLVEIGRGCPRGCRFCAAGHLFFPTRHRPLESLRPAIQEGISRVGRVGLVSSSVVDHPELREICEAILSGGGTLSVSSLRLDRLDDFLLESLVRSGHRTVSLAPEAGSQRMRDAIRKNISEEQILEAVARVAGAGIPAMRFYFMVGLPLEAMEDVEEIVNLTKRALHRARAATAGKGLDRLTLSVNPFVPKPFTPFQWHPFMEQPALKSRIQYIRRSLKGDRRIQVLYEPPKWSAIQALLARGDRGVAKVIALVAQGTSWDKALREVNLNPAFYLHRRRTREERFPWDFLDHGFTKESLWRAYERAMGGRPGSGENSGAGQLPGGEPDC